MSGEVLSLRDVSVRRGDRIILGPLNFSISHGERWVVLGPNGAGKSTLLQILATKIFPSQGEVFVLDKQMGKVDLFELRTRIGLCGAVIAEDIPYDENVKDVVLTAAYAILGRWNEDYDLWDESRAMALLTTFGVRELGNRLYGTLSEGEKKRVQISRALMTDPELLLLDEPAAGLDVGGREDLLKRFADFSSDPLAPATILVTHHIEEIPVGTTHALLLKDGHIAVSGPIDHVVTSEHVSAVFGSSISVTQEAGRFFARAIFSQLHPDWQKVLKDYWHSIAAIEEKLHSQDVAPPLHQIFRCLELSIDSSNVVIFGQDPYPTRGNAHGLAFSVDQNVRVLPASLRNIFTELYSDIGGQVRTNGDLSGWQEQGVLLINRILTTTIGKSMAHEKYGWQEITQRIAQILGERKVIGIFWGNYASEMIPFFSPDLVIQSPHPSPLSAYRGFFGSKPFSRANSMLIAQGKKPIKWN